MSDIFSDSADQIRSALEIESFRAEHKLNILRGWLALPNWNLDQACHVLSGIDPETNIEVAYYGPGQVKLSILPGHQLPHDPIECDDFYAAIRERYALVSQRLDSMGDIGAKRPRDLIDACLNHRIAPPWLQFAADDPYCADFLSDKARNWISLKPPLRGREKSRKGGYEKARKWHGGMAEGVVRFLERETRGGVPKSWFHGSGRPNWKKISNKVLNGEQFSEFPHEDRDYNYQTIANHVKKWFKINNLP